ncbi:hypothetical protein VTH82DRAFT_1893 [Thermothelomyces myriococcoides]
MVIASRWSVPIPRCSLQQWIFGSACGPVADHKAFIDPEKPDTNYLTLADYRLLGKRVALGLQEAGLNKGDRVLIFAGNSLLFPSVFVGVLMAGGIVTGANPTFVPRELAYQLKDSGASFMFVAEHAVKTAFEAAAEAGLPRNRIFVLGSSSTVPISQLARASSPGPGTGGRVGGARHWTELLAGHPEKADAWSWEEPSDPEETTCCLNYSSGTTGAPKGVEISHHSYVSNGVGIVFMNKRRSDYEARRKRSRVLALLPFYHAYGQVLFIANFPHQQIPVYVMPSFDFLKMLSYIQRFRITTLALVPPIIVLLTKHPATRKFDLSSIETVSSGAAPLSREVTEEAERLFREQRRGRADGDEEEIFVRQGWGMTELTCVALAWDHDTTVRTSAGVGEVFPNCRAKLVSLEDGRTPVERAGERGELWVTGPALMRRYWRRPEATAETIVVDAADGTRWLRTGDVAYVDQYKPGGIFYIVDRIKELIKVKGNQVAPAELEGILLDNPDVADAAVVGVTINGEELPRAYIVRKPGSAATEQDVAKWMEGKVVRYKQLKGGVAFVDAIPKNASGKILRKQLRERAQKEVGDAAKRASHL